MSDPIITLTTDFGDESPYVPAMKGVILSINPAARLVDLSHRIPPQDLRYTAFFLAASVPYFPPEAIHVVVVDPGVGTERALLYVEVEKRRLLTPDNGCWTRLAEIASGLPTVIRLTEQRYWRQPVSATFHGRDILAPVAGHLSLGISPATLGIPSAQWVRLEQKLPVVESKRLAGEVVFIDRFGNLITNIPGTALSTLAAPRVFKIGDTVINRQVRTYGEAAPGTLIALVSSEGMLEIAISRGNAACQLRVEVGTQVEVAAFNG